MHSLASNFYHQRANNGPQHIYPNNYDANRFAYHAAYGLPGIQGNLNIQDELPVLRNDFPVPHFTQRVQYLNHPTSNFNKGPVKFNGIAKRFEKPRNYEDVFPPTKLYLPKDLDLDLEGTDPFSCKKEEESAFMPRQVIFNGSSYQRQEELGKGTFGVCYRVTSFYNQSLVAKVLRKSSTHFNTASVIKEYHIMAPLRHPNIAL